MSFVMIAYHIISYHVMSYHSILYAVIALRNYCGSVAENCGDLRRLSFFRVSGYSAKGGAVGGGCNGWG